MQLTETITEKAKDIAFLTNYEARLILNLTSSIDETVDDMIEMLIEWSSDEIATNCNRTFAKETLEAVYREINTDTKRLQLTHYPIVDIESVVDGHGNTLIMDIDYEVDWDAGKLTRLGSNSWVGPTTVIYIGGYDLPAETPKALKQAAMLMTREAYFATQRGDATIRMVSHKDARVMYFDPSMMVKALAAGGGGNAGSPALRRIQELLTAYIHIEV